MQDPEPSTVAFVNVAMVLSLTALIYACMQCFRGRRLLEYESRTNVPWGPIATVVAFFLPSILAVLVLQNNLPQSDKLEPDEFIRFGWIQVIIKMATVLGVSAFLISLVQATPADLGLERSVKQSLSDFWYGVFACCLVLLPLYLVQYALTLMFEPQDQNPLIEQLQQSFSQQMLAVGIVLAIIVAPIYEEFVFRLLLQGWLEKWEDQALRRELLEQHSLDDAESAANRPEDFPPSQGIIPELPHGWLPILISGTVFGLAHFGQGVAPIPLVLFGIVLGYLYQRTHRLLPCIVAHMSFNGYTMALLWLESGKPPV